MASCSADYTVVLWHATSTSLLPLRKCQLSTLPKSVYFIHETNIERILKPSLEESQQVSVAVVVGPSVYTITKIPILFENEYLQLHHSTFSTKKSEQKSEQFSKKNNSLLETNLLVDEQSSLELAQNNSSSPPKGFLSASPSSIQISYETPEELRAANNR